jgi:RNA-directed DNA polymerase
VRRLVGVCAQSCSDLRATALSAVLRGHYAYFGILGNSTCLGRFRLQVMKAWRRVLLRRSQRPKPSWERFNTILKVFPVPIGHVRDWRHQMA